MGLVVVVVIMALEDFTKVLRTTYEKLDKRGECGVLREIDWVLCSEASAFNKV